MKTLTERLNLSMKNELDNSMTSVNKTTAKKSQIG